jgi:large subunit ribosomal protein L9
MRVILLQDIAKLGDRGNILEVKDGFARNFLLPCGKALEATEDNISLLKVKQDKDRKLQVKEDKVAQDLADKISKLSLTLTCEAKANEELFGSVTSSMIAAGLKDEGHDIDKDKIILEEPIKQLGIYNVKIRLSPSVDTEVKIWVVKK